MPVRRVLTLGALALAGLLAGCGQEAEIREWMEQTKSQTRIAVPKVNPPKTFEPFTYGRRDAIDPFNPSKLLVAIAKQRAQSGKGLKPDLERRREPLEQFPLDTISMVGLLQKPGLTYAILKVDKTIYQAKIGNYIGQNFGMITGISETGIDLKEIIQDASGEWVERKTRLELQESKK